MTDSTTIKVPKQLRDRLQQVAAAQGLTMAQALSQLLDRNATRPRPTIGGYRSNRPLSPEEIDRELGSGFGA